MKDILFIIALLLFTTVATAQNVVQAEYFIDADAGVGMNHLVTLTNPQTDGNYNLDISLSGLAIGYHKIYIRTRDSDGNWSCTARRNIEIISSNVVKKITGGEYFFDNVLGFDNAIPIAITAQDSTILQDFSVVTNGLSVGYHKLYIRAKDNDGNWSLTTRRNVEVVSSNVSKKITGGEYFFDNDPGFNTASSITITPQDSVILQNFTAVTNGLPVGYHKLYIRLKDNDGNWSLTTRRNVEVIRADTYVIAGAEYFFNSDPGIDSATPVSFDFPVSDSSFSFKIPLDKIITGAHTLYIRAKDSVNGNWSLTQWQKDSIVTSVQPGVWSQPGTWSSNQVPDSNTVVLIHHDVEVDIPNAKCRSLIPFRHNAHCTIRQNMKLTITGHR